MAANINFSFDEATHTYMVDGVHIPSCTQCLDAAGLVMYDKIDPEVLRKAAKIGDYVHQACAFYDEGRMGIGKGLDLEKLHPTLLPYVQAYIDWVKEVHFQPGFIERDGNKVALIEYQGIGSIDGMLVGFQLDGAGTIGTKGMEINYLIERKTTSVPLRVWGYQLAMYKMCISELAGYRRAGLQLRDNGKASVYPFDDDLGDEAVARAALVIATAKNNNRKSGGRA